MFDAQNLDHKPALPLQQSTAYGRMLTLLGRYHTVHDAPDVGQVLIVERQTPLGTVRMAARGPVWQSRCPNAQRTLLRHARVDLLNDETTPPDVLRAAGYVQLVTPATQAILGLCDDPERLTTAKFRASLRCGRQQNLTITQKRYDPSDDGWLIARDRDQQRKKRFRGYPAAWTAAYAQANPDDVRLFLAATDGAPCAAMMILTHGTSATYHIGWTNDAGRAACAHHQLLIAAARACFAKGITSLDLGQIDTSGAAGLARFKLSSGAIPHRLGGTWVRRPFARD